MLKRLNILWVFGLLWVTMAASAATVENPVTLLKGSVSKLQTEMAREHASLQHSPKKLYALVKRTIMPDVAVNRMAAMALGPMWRNASAKQRTTFIDEFGLMLTRAYAQALLQVTNYDITFNPMRSQSWKTARVIAVSGNVRPKQGGKSSAVTYYLVRAGKTWKIYDFAVEGVSFMRNFQSQFQSMGSVTTVIDKLIELNKKEAKA